MRGSLPLLRHASSRLCLFRFHAKNHMSSCFLHYSLFRLFTQLPVSGCCLCGVRCCSCSEPCQGSRFPAPSFTGSSGIRAGAPPRRTGSSWTVTASCSRETCQRCPTALPWWRSASAGPATRPSPHRPSRHPPCRCGPSTSPGTLSED